MLGVDGHATAQLPQIPSCVEQGQNSYLKFLTKGEAELVLEWVDVVAVVVEVVVDDIFDVVVVQRKDLDRPNLGPELVDSLHLKSKVLLMPLEPKL